MTPLSLVLLWSANREGPGARLKDTKLLSTAIANWKFVLVQEATWRAFNRFENRARWLAGYESHSEWVKKLVGLVALEEIGAIDSSDIGLNFEAWKKDKWKKSVELSLPTEYTNGIIEECTEEDWNRYRTLAARARFEDSTG